MHDRRRELANRDPQPTYVVGRIQRGAYCVATERGKGARTVGEQRAVANGGEAIA
jgi:hypothetical protein